jgi:hypothetical protein
MGKAPDSLGLHHETRARGAHSQEQLRRQDATRGSLGFLTHRGDTWYLAGWGNDQEMKIDERHVHGIQAGKREHEQDRTEPELNIIGQGRQGYRAPDKEIFSANRSETKACEN